MKRLLIGAVFALAACQGVAADSAVVSLTEGRIEVSNSTLAAGKATLEVVNDGEFNHTLVVATATGRVVAATEVITSGESIDLDLDLTPGEYEFTCRIVVQTADGVTVDHYAQGMVSHVTVTGDSGS
ncbi:MAG: hypothetical protein HKN07_03025 [Acidimicrobiia bacterium]|nr:hypothetical protein [Acidimicrobiia bacterium]